MGDLYETDFYTWANQQARLIREGRLADADLENIGEAIESIGRNEKRELVSRLDIPLLHLLKWRYQPERRSSSWEASIRNARDDLTDHLKDNPSLKSKVPDAIESAYRRARRTAAGETSLDVALFPSDCPWPFVQIMDHAFWPEAAV